MYSAILLLSLVLSCITVSVHSLKNFNTRYQIDRMRLESIRSLIDTTDIGQLQTTLRRKLPDSSRRDIFQTSSINSSTRELLYDLNSDGYISNEDTYINRLKLAIILATLTFDQDGMKGSVYGSWAS